MKTPDQSQRPVDEVRRLLAQVLGTGDGETLPSSDGLDAPWRTPTPELRPVPDIVKGFRIRIDLTHTRPPVWRRILVSGDTTLPELHEILQTTMGWTDSHLHRFRTGADFRAPSFLTPFDIEEGDEGMLEDGVRLDQVLAERGERAWYEYDFGDSWDHVLKVEEVLDDPPEAPSCVAGARACPPEDCGGTWGYSELARWARGGFAPEAVPEPFETAEAALAWLPEGWSPDAFDLDEINAGLGALRFDVPSVADEVDSLLGLSHTKGSHLLRDLLAAPAFLGPTDIDDEDAARITAPVRVVLDVIGDGVELTKAGYLRPADVEQIAQRTGITEHWIGKANREDLTPPVAQLRESVRALGLVSVRKGRIMPTQAAKRCAGSPQALVSHIVARLPLGTATIDRHAGWAALVVVGSGIPGDRWNPGISELLAHLGWHVPGSYSDLPPAYSPTLDVLRVLSGEFRSSRWNQRADPALAALARRAVLG